jgi:hypothetical protein
MESVTRGSPKGKFAAKAGKVTGQIEKYRYGWGAVRSRVNG